jgi:hypothetical protein
MKTSSFWLKYFEVLCLFFTLTGLAHMRNSWSKMEFQFVSKPSNLWLALAAMVMLSFLIAALWQRSNKGSRLHKWFEGIIIFYVAYSISGYGFAKLLGTQFHPALSILDTPVGDLNGFWLTWVYYSHSQALIFILGGMQIGGSILLMFRRTRLPAVFILLPVMLNIDLINHFYDISPLAYYNSAHYTFILLFLLFIDYEKLKIIFSYKGTMPINLGGGLLTIARVAVIAGAFASVFFLKQRMAPVTKINGEWQVQSFIKNDTTFTPNDYQDSVWSRIYFEWRYGCLFKYNAYRNEDKDVYGDYVPDETNHTILVSFKTDGKVSDSTLFHYAFLNDSLMNMYGRYKKDSVVLKLKRIK